MRKNFNILLIVVIVVSLSSCMSIFVTHKAKKWMKEELVPINKTCVERGHVCGNVFETKIIKYREPKLIKTRKLTIKVTPSDTTIYYKCLRCGDKIIEPLSYKNDTIWRKK